MIRNKFCMVILLCNVCFQCKWAERKYLERKRSKTYNKHLEWVQGKPSICPKNYSVQSVRERHNRLYFKTSAGECTLVFEFIEAQIKIKDSTRYRLELQSTKSLITIKTDTMLNSDVSVVAKTDIGWGFRYTWDVNSPKGIFTFVLYSKYGVDDHFDIIN